MRLFKQLLLCLVFAGGMLHGAIPKRDYERKNLVAAYLQDGVTPQKDVISGREGFVIGTIKGAADPFLSPAGCALFDAYSSVRIADNYSLQNNSFTVSMWVKVNTANTGGVLFSLTPPETVSFYGFSIGITSDKRWYVARNTGQTVVSNATVKGVAYWTHLAVTHKAGKVTIYVDGVEDITAGMLIDNISQRSEEACIGHLFSGALYDFRIFSEQKTAEYVNKLFLAGLPSYVVDGVRSYTLYQEGAPLCPPTRYVYAAPDEKNFTYNATEFNGGSVLHSEIDGRFKAQTFTISAWVNSADNRVDGNIMELLDVGRGGAPRWTVCQEGGDWTFRWYYGNGIGQESRIPVKIVNGEWKFLAVTVGGGQMTFYLDGTPRLTASLSPQDISVQPVFRVGSMFKGSIGSLRFDTRALTALQVKDRMRGWVNADEIVDGWDYALPSSVTAKPGTGMTTDFPLKSGERYRAIQVSWKDIEPVEGQYDFSQLKRDIANFVPDTRMESDGKYDGVVLRVRSCSKETDSSDPVNVKVSQFYPDWLVSDKGLVPVESYTADPNSPIKVENLPIWAMPYHIAYCNFARKLVQTVVAIPKPNTNFLKIHHVTVNGISDSRGEEFGVNKETLARFESSNYGVTAANLVSIFQQRFNAWKEYADARVKLVWMGDGTSFCGGKPDFVNTGSDVIDYAYDRKFGQRSGFVEFYLIGATNQKLGQIVSSTGHMSLSQSVPPLANNQVFGDENEEYRATDTRRFGPLDTFEYRYQQSMLRAMQMGRNHLWVSVDGADLNVPLTEYTALQLGKLRVDSPDASCYLRESTINETFLGPTVTLRTLRYFERYLTQRKFNDPLSSSLRAEPVMPGYMLSGTVFNNREYYNVPTDVSVTGAYNRWDYLGQRIGGRNHLGFGFSGRIGFTGGKACIKITYRDYGTGKIELRYFRSGDVNEPTGTRIITKKNSSKIRTASFFVNDIVIREGTSNDEFRIGPVDEVPVVILAARMIPLS